MRRLIAVLLFVLCAALPAHAQTVTWMLEWTQPGTTPTQAQGFLYRAVVDAAAPVVVTPVTCSTITTNTVCRGPRPPVVGASPHTISLTADNGFGVSLPGTTTGSGPSGPINVNVTVIVTVP